MKPGGVRRLLIPPELEAEETRILAELSRGQRIPPFDTERLTRDGRRIAVSVTISPIHDAAGRISGLLYTQNAGV